MTISDPEGGRGAGNRRPVLALPSYARRGPQQSALHGADVYHLPARPRDKIPKSETPGSDIRNFRFFASIKPQSARRQSCVLGSRRNAQIRALLVVANFGFLGEGVGRGSASAEFFSLLASAITHEKCNLGAPDAPS